MDDLTRMRYPFALVREGWVRRSGDDMTWVLTAAGLDVLNEATR